MFGHAILAVVGENTNNGKKYKKASFSSEKEAFLYFY
jgi:hypothetical protein